MDQIEAIIAYVLRTPYNTNPNILRGMLMRFGGEDHKEIEEATYEDILEGKYGTEAPEQEEAGE